MHWTLLVLIELCVGCAILNIAQWRMTRSVRPIGLMLCAVWMGQQSWWWLFGSDSLWVFLACDALMIGYLWRYSADWSDEVILALLFAGICVYSLEWAYGQSAQSWWALWSLVVAEMLLGLPRAFRQRIPGSVSHGRLHNAGGA